MPPEEMLSQLHELARRAGIEVRIDPFDLRSIEGRGGLCWLRGRPVVVMDAGMPLIDKVGVLASALAEFDLEPLCVPPVLRRRIRRRPPKSHRP